MYVFVCVLCHCGVLFSKLMCICCFLGEVANVFSDIITDNASISVIIILTIATTLEQVQKRVNGSHYWKIFCAILMNSFSVNC